MATYSVVPLGDGVDMRSNWQVKRNGQRISTHTKKSAAERTARSKADSGDRVVIHGTGGEVQRQAPTTRQQSRESDSAIDADFGLGEFGRGDDEGMEALESLTLDEEFETETVDGLDVDPVDSDADLGL